MGRYIDQILQPGEKVLYSTTLHGVIYLPAILAWLVAVGCFVMERRAQTDGGNLIWLILAAAAALAALFWTLRAWFRRWTTETDVTSLRIVHKEGFIQRSTFEMNLDKVESVDVNQSIPGRVLDYGDVTIFGVGEGRKTIAMIASPLQFRNHITAR
ncbi:PH domain-containing protein [Bradyrhizobium sp. U87765 SZCCT0131]|uniref:PH domain-containing protein n=1 Tax=unclassified Bradyrhizobium TaxID=2631580 RepID=UPI001BA785A5|nr:MULTISPECIES: PH domain-containing protein [unclassified Bradyrhizobium]MBR1217111.1 PH domain-containing protein [Bradyrhizobium sp. U87765 SZCCT0131]MBR1259133.1 PH domain-containing protein [Bradyrhizobium sp. U87765 SZCCT0134]MBR1305274.1 PH domain-containing protein [Bradyrhizobium sp. U87765 SZCCT0110]MBR1321060.1 PH domain-containing protein [Bradyrhizobium sp. U87765 SZCCT0109]MBR1350286.1 PH domain-containing protein [Bradyrhizobium sp. U87765 SZCCT0048]